MQTQLYQSKFMLQGEEQTLAQWQDKTILIVNTATKCGFAAQFKGLQALHETYQDEGLIIIGFPCDQFKNQEPESDQSMASICELNFGVTFPLTFKIDVNGDNTHPLFQALKNAAPGLFGSEKIKWNFTKFLISPHGTTIKRFAPTTKPQKLSADIEKMIAL
ncbi:MAG: glutathione peroxidase [Psychromonas sp.]|nr:glutathione peroxidase [Psychromonas sp.]